jgi:hypothetical protein
VTVYFSWNAPGGNSRNLLLPALDHPWGNAESYGIFPVVRMKEKAAKFDWTRIPNAKYGTVWTGSSGNRNDVH